MIGFHIDMNIAQFTREHIERWLHELSRLGYDTLVWEVENNIRWETCPECVTQDAFTKEEFREILALARDLGFDNIPLFQTIAHCEYVLKHGAYQPLSEAPGEIVQYCPRNPDLLPFLTRWVDEYLDLFGKVRHFHLGADEAWSLGTCDNCSAYAAEKGLSSLYVEHINALAEPLAAKGITPIIWADMALHHNEALDRLSRDIMLFDWMYDIHYGMGKFWVWGQGWAPNDGIPEGVAAQFGDYLFPEGDEPGRDPETFYTADFLSAQGFRVAMCPSSSSYGDNVFAPRNWHHLVNTFDSCHKGLQPNLAGSVLTSWTVHLFPWELQLAHISLPPYAARHPQNTIERYQEDFTRERLGVEDRDFWVACGLLSKRCLLSHTASLGFNKAAKAVPGDHARQTIEKVKAEGRLDAELENSRARLDEYRRGAALFEALGERVSKGERIMYAWGLAARNLVNRAEASAALLAGARGEDVRTAAILEDMRKLRDETERFYRDMVKPTRRAEIMGWIYASVEAALEEAGARG
jgi:hypothetical protein